MAEAADSTSDMGFVTDGPQRGADVILASRELVPDKSRTSPRLRQYASDLLALVEYGCASGLTRRGIVLPVANLMGASYSTDTSCLSVCLYVRPCVIHQDLPPQISNKVKNE